MATNGQGTSFLRGLLTGVKAVLFGGVAVTDSTGVTPPGVNFASGATGTYNPVTNTIDIAITATAAAGQNPATLSNGLNSNIATGGKPTIRLSGPTGAFSVGGFTAQPPGFTLTVISTPSQPLTVVPGDASSSPANRISTPGGAPFTTPARPSALIFVYDGTTSMWVLQEPGLQQPIVTHHVRDYGAVGNGNYYNAGNSKWYVDSGLTVEATDDSASINAAMLAAAATTSLGIQATVQLFGNHYLKTPNLLNYGVLGTDVFFTLTSNMSISGSGATMRLGPGLLLDNVAFFYSDANVSNVTISGLLFDGNSASGSPINERNPFICMIGDVNKNITIDGCQFTNHAGWNTVIVAALDGTGSLSQDVVVSNCGFFNVGCNATLTDHVALYLQGEGVTVSGNVFFNDPLVGSVGRNVGAAMQIQGNGVSVTGNSITNHCNALLFGSAFSAPALNSSDLTFTGNTVVACAVGIALFQSVGRTLSDIVITGNSFSISNSQSGQPESAIQCLNVNGSNGLGINRMVISDNVMTYVHDSHWIDTNPTAISLAVILTSCKIADNHVEGWGSYGTFIGPTIGFNTNPPTGTVTTAELQLWDLTIVDNVYRENGTTSGTAVLIQMDTATVPAPAQRIRIMNNHLSGSSAESIATGILCALSGDDIWIAQNQYQYINTPQTLTSSHGITNTYQGPLLSQSTDAAFVPVVTFDQAPTPGSIAQRDSLGNISAVNVKAVAAGGAFCTLTDVSLGLWFPSAGHDLTCFSIDAGGYAYVGQGANGTRFGLSAATASGGSSATLGAGVGVGGQNPASAAQAGWAEFLDGAGNPFWVPVWR